MPPDIKTDESLLHLREQRVSFIMGILPADSTVTRSQIESMLDQQEGERAS